MRSNIFYKPACMRQSSISNVPSSSGVFVIMGHSVFPLPRVDETLAQLNRGAVLIKLETSCVFWQIPLAILIDIPSFVHSHSSVVKSSNLMSSFYTNVW